MERQAERDEEELIQFGFLFPLLLHADRAVEIHVHSMADIAHADANVLMKNEQSQSFIPVIPVDEDEGSRECEFGKPPVAAADSPLRQIAHNPFLLYQQTSSLRNTEINCTVGNRM